MSKHEWLIVGIIVAMVGAGKALVAALDEPWQADRLRTTYSPLHFKPAIETATDGQCLECHRAVLTDRVRERSPAGLETAQATAWYQRVSTYEGEQDTFHRRHLLTPLAKRLMKLNCNTCHQGHDPREEAPGASATSPPQGDSAFTLRKQVNPETACLRCHGRMPWENMGIPGPWEEHRAAFNNSCTQACHDGIRTTRHYVNFLNREAIETEGAKNGEVCYGCHGGRAWYRIAFPYARHPWPGMSPEIPAWAKDRPAQTEDRFLVGVKHPLAESRRWLP